MRLSTSSFERPSVAVAARRASFLLLLAAALFAIGTEEFCRRFVPRISRIERRTDDEYAAAIRICRQPGDRRQVLILGNSLLESGLHFESASRDLLPIASARRLVVENTSYLDWYYGIRRLLADGARPDAFVLMLSPGQLVSTHYRGDYSAYHLLRTRDIWPLARDLCLSNTETSGLLFANFSAFFGLRAELRKFVAGKILPDLPELTSLITRHSSAALKPEDVYATALARLRALREIAAEGSADIILVIPPTGVGDTAATARAVRDAGIAARVSVLIPAAPCSFRAEDFSDGFHLNRRGAEHFTTRFVAAIHEELVRLAASGPN